MSDLFIVDNGDKNWKAKNYLHERAIFAHTFDVATVVRCMQDNQHDRTHDTSDEGIQSVAALHHHLQGSAH